MHIDDVQWSDIDSLVLLEQILQPPNAPKLLLVCGLAGVAFTAVQDLGDSCVLAGSAGGGLGASAGTGNSQRGSAAAGAGLAGC